ncbi:KTSC domain-containing protein [Kitasatospora sp. A2-31]|uniref:KTSC domain-containing protein n=1 Tax=Kitasatospora sp. A2-31 TaxID=2916414 RepID=UPI001EEB5023|nr:KTSC domain-containing protein [Kitasatospora sp. A2-31]MCG6494481.1 KTSC domain-containing protein [Kitasatospora sp. A2-31]
MDRMPVDSSALRSVGYDAARRVLEVEFVGGGVYAYDSVPRRVHGELMAAESHGRYFVRRIRGRYPYRRLG